MGLSRRTNEGGSSCACTSFGDHGTCSPAAKACSHPCSHPCQQMCSESSRPESKSTRLLPTLRPYRLPACKPVEHAPPFVCLLVKVLLCALRRVWVLDCPAMSVSPPCWCRRRTSAHTFGGVCYSTSMRPIWLTCLSVRPLWLDCSTARHRHRAVAGRIRQDRGMRLRTWGGKRARSRYVRC
jgi:hypothetical protein